MLISAFCHATYTIRTPLLRFAPLLKVKGLRVRQDKVTLVLIQAVMHPHILQMVVEVQARQVLAEGEAQMVTVAQV